MYRHTPPPLDPLASNTIAAGEDGTLSQDLWRQVRGVFPNLSASRFRLEQSGGDHLVLIVDETRAFRFPRPGTHSLDLEIRMLEHLRHQARVAIPTYDLVDPDGGFAGYPLIVGVPLSPARFIALPGIVAKAATAAAVMLLKLLHALDPGAIAANRVWPRMWSAARYSDRIESDRLPLLATRIPAVAKPIKDFLSRYRRNRPGRHVVLHGDLVSDHLLVDEHTGCLAGIIDFSDVALGDPAQDLSGFWAYGASAAAYAVACYDPGNSDRTLLARSFDHFVRYRIDRLYEMIIDGAPAAVIDRHAAALAAHLASPPRP